MSNSIKRLTVTAVLLALATVLSLIKVWTMPLGGSITLLSMLPIVLISAMFGVRWGVVASTMYALIQLALDFGSISSWGLTPAVFAGSIVFDYLIAFGVLGFAGVFRKKSIVGISLGTALVVTIRFISHVFSGTIFFASFMPEGWTNPLVYSVCYNGTFMLPELVATVVAVSLIFQYSSIRKLYE